MTECWTCRHYLSCPRRGERCDDYEYEPGSDEGVKDE